MSEQNPPLLSAALIVKDESSQIEACLASVREIVDQIHVVDTGSTDNTINLARATGAAVTSFPWADDFAAARNAALDECSTEWVVSIDADERLVANADAARGFLRSTEADAVVVDIDNLHNVAPYTHPALRVFRRESARWEGRVHEQLTSSNALDLRITKAPREVMYLQHLGYEAPEVRTAKSARNAALGEAMLLQLESSGDADPTVLAATMLDIGRSYVGSDRKPNAVAIFEAVREQFPESREWIVATDFLARLHLAAGNDEIAIELSEQLRKAGASSTFCNWLAAQGYVQLGQFALAQQLLASVDEVIDTSGRRYAGAALVELKEIIDRLVEISSTTDPTPPL